MTVHITLNRTKFEGKRDCCYSVFRGKLMGVFEDVGL
jgi:hypothetical protein